MYKVEALGAKLDARKMKCYFSRTGTHMLIFHCVIKHGFIKHGGGMCVYEFQTINCFAMSVNPLIVFINKYFQVFFTCHYHVGQVRCAPFLVPED